MKFAKVVFYVAGIWGLLVLTPLFFIFDRIGQQDPPAVTHPGFYYGFVTVGLAWQIAFLIIARDPIRLRPIMIAAMVEKFAYVIAMTALYFQQRVKAPDKIFVAADLIFGVLFVVAFLKLSSTAS
jgi:urea transporter